MTTSERQAALERSHTDLDRIMARLRRTLRGIDDADSMYKDIHEAHQEIGRAKIKLMHAEGVI